MEGNNFKGLLWLLTIYKEYYLLVRRWIDYYHHGVNLLTYLQYILDEKVQNICTVCESTNNNQLRVYHVPKSLSLSHETESIVDIIESQIKDELVSMPTDSATFIKLITFVRRLESEARFKGHVYAHIFPVDSKLSSIHNKCLIFGEDDAVSWLHSLLLKEIGTTLTATFKFEKLNENQVRIAIASSMLTIRYSD